MTQRVVFAANCWHCGILGLAGRCHCSTPRSSRYSAGQIYWAGRIEAKHGCLGADWMLLRKHPVYISETRVWNAVLDGVCTGPVARTTCCSRDSRIDKSSWEYGSIDVCADARRGSSSWCSLHACSHTSCQDLSSLPSFSSSQEALRYQIVQRGPRRLDRGHRKGSVAPLSQA